MLAYWVHDMSPFLIRFTENFGVRYYGLAYVLGFVWTWRMLRLCRRKGKSPLNAEQEAAAFYALLAGVVLGARLGYFLLYDAGILLSRPWVVFKIWEGGMSSHGGFIGIALAVGWVSKKHKTGYWRLADLLSSFGPLVLFIGRLANFINGELWGKVTTVPWAVIFPQSAAAGVPAELIAPRHPSQLYEAFGEGLLLFICAQMRFWKSGVTERPGRLTGETLIFYSLARIICEQFREPDAPLISGLSRGTFYSLFLLALGGFLIFRARATAKAAA